MAIEDATMRSILASQYHAALAMLRDPIDRCPEDLWLDTTHRNAFWQIAYHTLFFTHLYMGKDRAAFRSWAEHQADVQQEDGFASDTDDASGRPMIPSPYTKNQVLAYWAFCDAMVDPFVAAVDLRSPESGFYWYTESKLEHQFINIRHIQHHAAQLADRLRATHDLGTPWVSSRRR
jgi:hypothetical protein